MDKNKKSDSLSLLAIDMAKEKLSQLKKELESNIYFCDMFKFHEPNIYIKYEDALMETTRDTKRDIRKTELILEGNMVVDIQDIENLGKRRVENVELMKNIYKDISKEDWKNKDK